VVQSIAISKEEEHFLEMPSDHRGFLGMGYNMPDDLDSSRIARRERVVKLARALNPKPASHLLSRQRALSKETIKEFESFVRANYTLHPPSYWETPEGRHDLSGLASGRLARQREIYIPWLDSIHPLKGLRVLEIGCGTGSSTVALAEQGAEVTGIEMEEAALAVARKQCDLYGVQAHLIHGNAADAHETLDIGSYDLIIFFAVLEHMMHIECLSCLNAYWRKMKPGTLLGIIDTPNRLWLYDDHTSQLPFFHWLPGEIAIRYCANSSRRGVAELHEDTTAAGMVRLQRWGRGISFHEFELALSNPVGELPIVSSLGHWRRRRDLAQVLKWIVRDRPYHRVLRRMARDVPAPWLEPFIDIMIRRVDAKTRSKALAHTSDLNPTHSSAEWVLDRSQSGWTSPPRALIALTGC
jgi:2-polyprenyl-3-methyl-5-hydroxy-6-metoxy-1,4-benzoquinol methylase